MLRTKTHNKETSSAGSETKISVRIRHHRIEVLKNITTMSRAAAFLVVIARCFIIIQFGSYLPALHTQTRLAVTKCVSDWKRLSKIAAKRREESSEDPDQPAQTYKYCRSPLLILRHHHRTSMPPILTALILSLGTFHASRRSLVINGIAVAGAVRYVALI